MNVLERINAVLHGERPDRVPYVPYDNLVPRGDFERELRNRGMGLFGIVHNVLRVASTVDQRHGGIVIALPDAVDRLQRR